MTKSPGGGAKRSRGRATAGSSPVSSPPPSKKAKNEVTGTIVDQLKSRDCAKALKALVESADQDYSLVREFLNLNGCANDLLRSLSNANDLDGEEGGADDPNRTQLGGKKVKSGSVSLVFNAVETVLLFLAGEEGSERKALAMDLTRKMLQKHTR